MKPMAIDYEAWKRFGVATAALTVAFLLAVYSEVLAHEGNVIGTAAAGSAALALAGFVAVTAVPYLARRTSIEWLRSSVDSCTLSSSRSTFSAKALNGHDLYNSNKLAENFVIPETPTLIFSCA